VKDFLLTLKADILGPLDESGEIALGLDILADTEVSGSLLDERVLDFLGSTSPALRERGGSGLLLSGL